MCNRYETNLESWESNLSDRLDKLLDEETELFVKACKADDGESEPDVFVDPDMEAAQKDTLVAIQRWFDDKKDVLQV
jgi:hypothetical protein